MLFQFEAPFPGNLLLALLDGLIEEFLDMTTLHANDVVMMATAVQLEHRVTAFEVVSLHQAGAFELGQHPVNRRQANLLPVLEQQLVDILGADMALFGRFQQSQDLDAWQRDLQPRPFDVLVVQALPLSSCPKKAFRVSWSAILMAMAQLMQKILIIVASALLLAACGSTPEQRWRPVHSLLERFPWMYRPEIQQGNIVTQEAVNRLKPGMSKRRVRFLLGSPMLTDTFHPDRWNYVYTLGKGSRIAEEKRLVLFFEDDRLTRLEGDYHPEPQADREAPKEQVVSVPDYVPEPTGVFDWLMSHVGLGHDKEDDEHPE